MTTNQGTIPAGSPIYLPPNLSWVDPWQGEVDSSNLLAAVVGNDILPDMYISRIPVNSVAELNTVINKTISYEQSGVQPFQRRVAFVADNIPDPLGAGDFIASSEAVINSYLSPAYTADRIYENNFGCSAYPCPAVNYALTRTFNMTGALFVNYTGHGSLNLWSDEKIFVNANIATLTNTGQLPILLSMTCLDGYYLHPLTSTASSLIELNVRAANGGAVAAFSPTGLGVANGHDFLEQGFFTAVFANGVQRLGPAALAAKLRLFATGSHSDLIETFTVFGDPALRLPTYALSMTPALTLAKAGHNGQVITYTLRVTNSAFMTDSLSYTSTGNLWPVSFLPVSVPPSQGRDVVVSVTIPYTAALGSSDVATVTVKSHGDATRLTTVLTTSVANVYLHALSATPAAQTGDPGQPLTYVLIVTNTGNAADVLDVTSSGNAWPTQISTDMVALSPGAELTFTAQVTIPTAVAAGSVDHIQIQTQSRNNAFQSSVHLTTTVNTVYSSTLYPTQVSSAGMPGQAVVYYFQIANIGSITQSFNVTGTSVWPLDVEPALVGPVSPGNLVAFTVTTHVPITATGNAMATAIVTATPLSGLPGPLVANLTTGANAMHDVELATEVDALSVDPGASAVYAIKLDEYRQRV